MNIFRCLILIIVFLGLSCNQKNVFSEFDKDFKNNRWSTSEGKSFNITLDKDIDNANLQLHFSHVYDFQFQYVPFEIDIFYPDKTKEVIPVNAKIKDDNGKDIADCTGDLCDLYIIIKENANFKNGDYKFVIKNKFNGSYLPNVLGVGINLSQN